MNHRILRLSLGLSLLASALAGQSTPTARPADVATIDSLIPALYSVISGPVGQPRQWDRFFSLMRPEARLIPTRCTNQLPCTLRLLTPLDYRQRADSFLVSSGFVEKEISHRIERFGSIAHVFSTYVSYHKGETTPFSRGINSIQLFWDGQRWWVLQIYWDSERQDNPIPTEYLGTP
ncbi:MAG: hypothetical protein ABI765_02340 [Gemmatimonadota bacterium]